MQGKERADRQLLDAGALVGHLVPAGSMFAFLAAHRGELFTDEDFADLFPSGKGRPSVPASVMASVMVLQVLHDYSDAEAAEAARCDLRWKAACGFPLDHPGFDPSTLVYWRRRLARSGRPHRINDAVAGVIAQTGVLKGRRRRAVDSTILADAVATQDTITQLIAAIRRVARVVPGAAGQIAELCTAHDYSGPGKPRIDWDDPQAKDGLVSALVNDANALLAMLEERDLDEPGSSAAGLLALVAGQDVEPAEGSDGTDGRWRIARKVAEDRVISVNDPDARHTRKSPENRRDGYRAHLAACPETGIITGEQLTRAAGEENSDAAAAVVALLADRGRSAVVGIGAQIGRRHRYLCAAPGGGRANGGLISRRRFSCCRGLVELDDFDVDENAGPAGCPARRHPRISPVALTFGAACCRCPAARPADAEQACGALIRHPR